MSGPGRTLRRLAVGSILLLSPAFRGFAPAAPAPEGAAIAASGTKAGVPACSSCHGARGEGNAAAGFPRLAAMPAAYLRAQLEALAAGRRRSAVMGPVAKLLTAPEIAATASYYAALPPPPGHPTRTAGVGASLALDGRAAGRLPACDACHGPSGIGVGANFPALAGQPAAYIEAELAAFRQGSRPPGPLAVMPAVARRLSAADIDAVAAYFASLGAPAAPAPASPAPASPTPAVAAPAASPIGFRPPARSAIPPGPLGEVIRDGEAIFRDTARKAPHFVGNRLTCSNCHLDAGRLADASPMWAAWVVFPTYRAKNGKVNTFAERIQGCFEYSMDGKAPPLGDPTLVALESYAAWLATGAPSGGRLAGRGYPAVPKPAAAPDYARGRTVYAQNCALCHGPDGAGQSAGGRIVFPPLWGAQSYNWGAGMTSVAAAAGFIKANMPLGLGGSLDDQDAWDVAMFVDGHERPQDPRFAGSLAETRRRFHKSRWSMYGRTVDGHVLGSASPPAGGSLR